MLLCVPNIISCQEDCNITAQSQKRKPRWHTYSLEYLLCAHWRTEWNTSSYINLRIKVLHTVLYYNNIGTTEAPLLWEKARNSLSGPGLCSAEWQITRFKVLLLAVMVLLSITHINLACVLYVLQSNNINICKPNLEVPYVIYLNKLYIAEL